MRSQGRQSKFGVRGNIFAVAGMICCDGEGRQNEKVHHAVNQLTASGPFTTTDNFLFEPSDRAASIRRQKVTLITYTKIKKGTVGRSFDELFCLQMLRRVVSLVEGQGQRKIICINPGRLAKGERGSTFAELKYHGSADKMNACIIRMHIEQFAITEAANANLQNIEGIMEHVKPTIAKANSDEIAAFKRTPDLYPTFFCALWLLSVIHSSQRFKIHTMLTSIALPITTIQEIQAHAGIKPAAPPFR
uniref:Uncharacterized protein n=1 Tax=Salix viminalis TaxID=40686 RepID=A0A6N2MNE2_SALVM